MGLAAGKNEDRAFFRLTRPVDAEVGLVQDWRGDFHSCKARLKVQPWPRVWSARKVAAGFWVDRCAPKNVSVFPKATRGKHHRRNQRGLSRAFHDKVKENTMNQREHS